MDMKDINTEAKKLENEIMEVIINWMERMVKDRKELPQYYAVAALRALHAAHVTHVLAAMNCDKAGREYTTAKMMALFTQWCSELEGKAMVAIEMWEEEKGK